jgi:hypothetical protein
VQGIFTTRKYDSRSDFDADRPSDIVVAHNRFTVVGMTWMWNMLAGNLRKSDGTLNDHLGSARIVIGNSDQPFDFSDQRLYGDMTAQAELDMGFPTVTPTPGDEGPDAVAINFRSTFGEDQAIFEWQERGVVSAQGVLIDRAVADGGRKPLGAVWTCEATLILDS